MNLDVRVNFEPLLSSSPLLLTNPTNLTKIVPPLPGEVLSCHSNGTDEYESFYRTSQFVTGLIIYPILCITGVLGNSLSLIVLSHKDMATSTNIYLLALGISDSLKLLNDFLYSIMLIIALHNPGAAESMMANVYPYAHYVFQVAVSVTAWLTVSVAVDRYISVCYPSRSKTLCTIPKARTVVTSVFVIMTLLSIPSVFRYRLETIVDVQNNKTCMEVVVTELGRNQHFMIPYTWVQNLLRGIIPVFILIFINAKIINVLRRERVKGKKLSSRNRITLMLIAMVLIFILCLTPDAIMSTFFGKGYVEEDYMFKGIREITDSLVTLNSAVNFILYCSLSAIFRNTFMRVFFGRRYVQMRGSSCRQISRDGTTSIRTKSARCSTRQNRNGSDKRDRRKSGCRDVDFLAGDGVDEKHWPKNDASLNGVSNGKQASSIINKNDRDFIECEDEKEKKINEMRLMSGVYMGPMTSGVYTGPTSITCGVYTGPKDSPKLAAKKEQNKSQSQGVCRGGPNLEVQRMDSGVYMGPTLEDLRLSSGVYMGPTAPQAIPPKGPHIMSGNGFTEHTFNSDTQVIFLNKSDDSECVQL